MADCASWPRRQGLLATLSVCRQRTCLFWLPPAVENGVKGSTGKYKMRKDFNKTRPAWNCSYFTWQENRIRAFFLLLRIVLPLQSFERVLSDFRMPLLETSSWVNREAPESPASNSLGDSFKPRQPRAQDALLPRDREFPSARQQERGAGKDLNVWKLPKFGKQQTSNFKKLNKLPTGQTQRSPPGHLINTFLEETNSLKSARENNTKLYREEKRSEPQWILHQSHGG